MVNSHNVRLQNPGRLKGEIIIPMVNQTKIWIAVLNIHNGMMRN